MKKTLLIVLSIAIIFSTNITAFAHSGRTDSSGGHYNRSTGVYHYHNGGTSSGTSTDSSTSTPSSSTPKTTTYSTDSVQTTTYYEPAPAQTTTTVSKPDIEQIKEEIGETKKILDKNFDNTVIVIYIGKLSNYQEPAKVKYTGDISSLDKDNLVFYNFNFDKKQYTLIKEPNYKVADSALSFETNSNEGYVIITDKKLTK